MSRMELNQIAKTPLDFQEIATNHESDLEFVEITSDSTLRFQCPALITSFIKIHCNASITKPGPLIPQSHHQKISDYFYGLLHPSIRSTAKLITNLFI